MVLGGERHVLCAGAGEDIGPVVWIVEFGAEHGGEVEVGEVGAVVAVVKFAASVGVNVTDSVCAEPAFKTVPETGV